MTFHQLMEVAAQGYHFAPSDYLWLDCPVHKFGKGEDNLAIFLTKELFDNFDPDVEDCIQLGTAMDILQSVKEDIDAVLVSLSKEFHSPERN